MIPVVLRVSQIKKEINRPLLNSFPKAAKKVQDVLTAEGYYSISISVDEHGVPENRLAYTQGIKWCHQNMGEEDFQRVCDRLFFMKEEHAILFKLMFT